MKLEEFIKIIAEEFDETPIEKFAGNTEFKNLDEWGSLAALSIISAIDDELDIQITGAELNKNKTIEDLFNLVQSKL